MSTGGKLGLKAIVLGLVVGLAVAGTPAFLFYQQNTGLATAVKDRESQISTLQSRVQDLENQISQKTSEVSRLQGEVTSLESQRRTDAATIDSLNSRISSLNSEISSLRSQVSSLNSQISSLQSELASLLSILGVPEAKAQKIRWDIVSLNFTATTITINPSGTQSAVASDESLSLLVGSLITFTGSGTFVPTNPADVTGGGSWETFDANFTSTGKGTYRVIGLLSWEEAPGTLPSTIGPFTIVDNTGTNAEARAGVAVLKIKYSDGIFGVLVVSCILFFTPAGVFEGVTASKGFVNYWLPTDPLNEDPTTSTVFHVVP